MVRKALDFVSFAWPIFSLGLICLHYKREEGILKITQMLQGLKQAFSFTSYSLGFSPLRLGGKLQDRRILQYPISTTAKSITLMLSALKETWWVPSNWWSLNTHWAYQQIVNACLIAQHVITCICSFVSVMTVCVEVSDHFFTGVSLTRDFMQKHCQCCQSADQVMSLSISARFPQRYRAPPLCYSNAQMLWPPLWEACSSQNLFVSMFDSRCAHLFLPLPSLLLSSKAKSLPAGKSLSLRFFPHHLIPRLWSSEIGPCDRTHSH